MERYREFTLAGLIKTAKIKFDCHIDPIQLGAQFMKAKDICDLPRMIGKTSHKDWRDYFVQSAKSLSTDIFS
jgi:hypothetical protein